MGLNLVIAILTTWCTSFSLKYSFDSSPVWISTVTVPTYRWSWATASSPPSTASSSAPSSCPTRASTTAWPPRTASSASSPRSACECWARPWWACWRTNNSLRGRGPAHCTPRSCWRRSARRRAWPCSSTAKRGRSSRTCSRGSRSNSLRRPGRSGGTWPNWNPCWTGGRAATAAITSQRCDTWLLLQRLTHAFLRFYSSFSSQTAELRCGRTVKKKKNKKRGGGCGESSAVSVFSCMRHCDQMAVTYTNAHSQAPTSSFVTNWSGPRYATNKLWSQLKNIPWDETLLYWRC